MSTPRPFPIVTGRCVCNAVRYRLLKPPLFCNACHCPVCQKYSGGPFVTHALIETSNITVISSTAPTTVSWPLKTGGMHTHIECKECSTQLWGHYNQWEGNVIADVRVGTLDVPGLMMPDMHSFVESKIEWMALPEGARTSQRHYDYKTAWPKSSLKRLEECLEKFKAEEREKKSAQVKVVGVVDDVGGEGEKTPTGVDAEEVDDEEDDEAFEKRFKETERALQERLERLTLKLSCVDTQREGGEVVGKAI